VAQAEAQVAAQRRVVERLRHGSRPDEMAQARANLESAKVGAVNARRPYERLKSLVDCSVRGAVSPLAAAAPAARHPARCLSVLCGADLLSPAIGALAWLGVGPPAQQLSKQQSHCAAGNTGWGAVYSFATLHAFWWLCPNTGTQPPLRDLKIIVYPKQAMEGRRWRHTTCPGLAVARSALPPGASLLWSAFPLSDTSWSRVQPPDGHLSTSWCGQTGVPRHLSRARPHASGAPRCPNTVRWGCTYSGRVDKRPIEC
jgi:hypothetical protein